MTNRHHVIYQQSLILFRLSIMFFMLTLCAPAQADENAEEQAPGFDHFTTGFPLIGRHEVTDCASCHIAGQFKGTPLDCGLCHNGIRAPGKHPQHFPSSNFCDNCHTEYTWIGARFDHSEVQGVCQDCHNNIVALGKSPAHILSSPNCEDCHNTITFDRVGRVDHASVIGTCSSCHNGFTASGKPPDHIITIAECDLCHSTNTWLNAIFDHSLVTGTCSSCHNGVIAIGKPPDHIPTTEECNSCHTVYTWSGADD